MCVYVTLLISAIIHYSLSIRAYRPIFLREDAQPQEILASFMVFTGAIVGAHGALAEWMEIWGKTDNDLFRTHRNIIANTLLWSTIFWGLIFYDRTKLPEGLEVRLVDVFLLGRVVFSVGYIMGAVVGHQVLRAFGFGFTFMSVCYVLKEIVGP
jgi:hypothetical protein